MSDILEDTKSECEKHGAVRSRIGADAPPPARAQHACPAPLAPPTAPPNTPCALMLSPFTPPPPPRPLPPSSPSLRCWLVPNGRYGRGQPHAPLAAVEPSPHPVQLRASAEPSPRVPPPAGLGVRRAQAWRRRARGLGHRGGGHLAAGVRALRDQGERHRMRGRAARQAVRWARRQGRLHQRGALRGGAGPPLLCVRARRAVEGDTSAGGGPGLRSVCGSTTLGSLAAVGSGQCFRGSAEVGWGRGARSTRSFSKKRLEA